MSPNTHTHTHLPTHKKYINNIKLYRIINKYYSLDKNILFMCFYQGCKKKTKLLER